MIKLPCRIIPAGGSYSLADLQGNNVCTRLTYDNAEQIADALNSAAPEDIAMLLEERDQLKAQIEEMRVAMWPTINFYLRSKIKELEDSRIVAWWSKHLLAGDLHKIVNVYKKYFGRGPTS